MNCIFIYNPVSGKGRIRKRIKYVVDKLREKYEIVDVYETRACGDMTAAAREAAKKYDAIVFSGGDGSFNEVLQGVASAEIMPELGYIPSGTVNVLVAMRYLFDSFVLNDRIPETICK